MIHLNYTHHFNIMYCLVVDDSTLTYGKTFRCHVQVNFLSFVIDLLVYKNIIASLRCFVHEIDLLLDCLWYYHTHNLIYFVNIKNIV